MAECKPCPEGTTTVRECTATEPNVCLGKVEIPALSASFLGQESSLHHLNLGVRSPKTFFIRMRGLGLQVLQSGRTNYDKCVGGGGTSGVVRLARCTHTHTHTHADAQTRTHTDTLTEPDTNSSHTRLLLPLLLQLSRLWGHDAGV